jgi:hypothetical protein
MRKRPEEKDAPIGTPNRPNRTEPNGETQFGSSVYSSADCKYLTEKASRSVIASIVRTSRLERREDVHPTVVST